MSEWVRHSFRKWDTEGKGVISKNELTYILRHLDPQTTDGELNILFSVAEMGNDDPRISYERFVSWLFSDAPEVRFSLDFLCSMSAAKGETLYEEALKSSIIEACERHAKAKVEAYFADVAKKVTGEAFTSNVRGIYSLKFGETMRITLDEFGSLADSTVNCTADMATVTKPTKKDISTLFALAEFQGTLGLDDALGLVRVLQVRVALATLLESENRARHDVRRYQDGETLRARGLWQGALASARAKAAQRFSEAAVETYFREVHDRLNSSEYATHVKGEFFRQTDANKDGKVSFEEALGVINSTLQCASDLGGSYKPTPQAIREAFDAHDTIEEGWNYMGGDEFLNLMRYLQVQVAEVMLPLSKLVKAA